MSSTAAKTLSATMPFEKASRSPWLVNSRRGYAPHPLVADLPRQVGAAGDARRQAREIRIRGVRGEHQDEHGRELHTEVERAAAAEGPARYPRDDGPGLRRHD